MGPPLSFISPVGAGLALVAMTTASQPFMALITASASVTSQTTTLSAGTPLSTSAAFDSSERTTPSGENSGRASILRNTDWPVWPPAPLTKTLSAALWLTHMARTRARYSIVLASCAPASCPRVRRRLPRTFREDRRTETRAAGAHGSAPAAVVRLITGNGVRF
eukprot:scaffold64837_cov51-Phaeocystis_antarctica.AAC.2